MAKRYVIPTHIIAMEEKAGTGFYEPLPKELLQRIISIKYEDKEDIDVLHIEVDNMDLQVTDEKRFQRGILVRMHFGYTEDISGPRYFFIAQIRGYKKITLVCNEEISILNMTRRNNNFGGLKITLAELLEKITANYPGLGFKTNERKDLNGTVIKYTYNQVQQGDLTFLFHLGLEIGYKVWVEREDNDLYFMPRKYWQKPTLLIDYKKHTGIIKFEPVEHTMNRKGKFAGKGVDLEKKALFKEELDPNKSKRTFYLGKKSVDKGTFLKRYANLEKARLLRVPLQDRKQAHDILQGSWEKEMEDQITATLILVGDFRYKARRVITLKGFAQKYDGNYYVKKVDHVISVSNGFRSTLMLTRNSSFDKGEKYALANIQSFINKENAQENSFLVKKAEIESEKQKSLLKGK